MDYFTNNIIRMLYVQALGTSTDWCLLRLGYELRAITAVPTPDPAQWAFSPANDHVFVHNAEGSQRLTPEEWMVRGLAEMQRALAV
jgi:hypothetical protein